ncbi:MAG: CerR family C-terminal domain-containing protein [Burkholderiales bacterium]|nr:CerR family C-terminal domain-containing protein [Burkholderiales bacterium]
MNAKANLPRPRRTLTPARPARATAPAADAPPAEMRKGDLARTRLLLAALEVFGECGFDAATTRDLAQRAGVNLGAIPYYFSSKQELHEAAAAYLADNIAQRVAQPLQELQAVIAQTQERKDERQGEAAVLIDAVARFLMSQARTLLAGDVPPQWLQFFLRAQAEGGPAFESLFNAVLEPARRAVAEAIGRIVQRPAADPTTRMLTFMAFHQTLYARVSDAALRRHLGGREVTPRQVDALLQHLDAGLRAQLQAAMPAPASPKGRRATPGPTRTTRTRSPR